MLRVLSRFPLSAWDRVFERLDLQHLHELADAGVPTDPHWWAAGPTLSEMRPMGGSRGTQASSWRFARQAALLRIVPPSARTGSRTSPTPASASGQPEDPRGLGTRDAEGRRRGAQRPPPRHRRGSPRFHDASTAPFRGMWSADAMAEVPLRKRAREYGRCPARTGDLLLVRREQLLRSTAVCRSDRSVSDFPPPAAALCCGLSLPQRFHMIAPACTRKRDFSGLCAEGRRQGRFHGRATL